MPSIPEASLQKHLSLYRKLLALIQAPRSEEELICFVIDTIFEQFPDYRASFAWLSGSTATIVYSRQPAGMRSLSGITVDLSVMGGVIDALRRKEPVVISDIRGDPGLNVDASKLASMGANFCRIDVPFADFEGNSAVLSLTSATPVEWPNETVVIMTEISELVRLMLRGMRAEQQLVRNETVFRQFAENVQAVFWMADLVNGKLVYVSPAYEKIWGRSVESLMQDRNSYLEAIHPRDRERMSKALAEQRQKGLDQTYRVVKPDGEIRWIKDRGFLVRDDNGEVYRIVGIAEDITALREAQDRLEATQAQVITNAKFAALGEMASGIAHEINNPLAVIHGLAVQLQEMARRNMPVTPMVIDSLVSMEKKIGRASCRERV